MKGQRSGPEEQRLQGHWLLAKLGKRVLRPGGIELTRQLLQAANPSSSDRIVEFGPGVGRTAQILLAANPRSYRGVDPNPQGTSQLLQILESHRNAQLVAADARETGLPNGSADLVVGEAMLTMHSQYQKLQIMREAHRILAPGGRYAVHELGFTDNVTEATAQEVAHALSRTIKVGARPLTTVQWRTALEEAGFEVRQTFTNAMALLEPHRIIADEGPRGAARFFFNVARNSAARKRLLGMRRVFRTNRDSLQAVALVAYKR